MATVDIIDARRNGNRVAEDKLRSTAEFLAPPLVPNGENTTCPSGPFQRPKPNNLRVMELRFGPRRQLVAGVAIAGVLGVAGLSYFFVALPGAKAPNATAESFPSAIQASPNTSLQSVPNASVPKAQSLSETLVQPGHPEPRAESSSETPVPSTPAVPEPSLASDVVPSPNIPAASRTAEAPQVAPSAVPPHRKLVFLQRPGVNIRSGPAGNTAVLGTAPKGTQFTVTSQEGDWVQVENPRWKGWINSQFLAPKRPL